MLIIWSEKNGAAGEKKNDAEKVEKRVEFYYYFFENNIQLIELRPKTMFLAKKYRKNTLIFFFGAAGENFFKAGFLEIFFTANF